MGILDKLYPTANSISKFIQRDVVQTGIGWLTYQNVKTSDHLKNLNSVHTTLTILKDDNWNTVRAERKWENLNTRLFQAEMGISHKFQLLQLLLSNENRSEECISGEVEHLRNGILDVNSGVLRDLSVINQVLIGKTVTNPAEKGIIELWSQGVFNDNVINQMHAKALENYLMKYWTTVAVLQFKGLLLFFGASTNSDFCLDQYDVVMDNLESQHMFMENTMPRNLKYLTEPDENNLFVLRPFFDDEFEPFLKRNGKTKTLVNEYFCGYNAEGKWIFEKSDKDDDSLNIASSCKRNYLKVSNNNKVEFVLEKQNADSFHVIPLDLNQKRMKIIISQTKADRPRFLGNSLDFTNEESNIIFTMTKYNNTSFI